MITEALALSGTGLSDRAVAQRLGVPRATIGWWRRRQPASRSLGVPDAAWRVLVPSRYAYLLGAYLGDGHVVVTSPRSARLVITLDTSFPGIVAEVREAMDTTFPGARTRAFLRMGGSCQALQICDPNVLSAFPQHGPGRKHERPILLTPWQLAITRAHPRELLRGLIHSDGCRTVNRFRTKLPSGRFARYEYPRYFFSNLSADIRAIFCEHCELLGIRWTQSNPRNISVAHRNSVALMDEFIGAKR